MLTLQRNFFLDKLAFDCDILRNFAMCNLSVIKRWTAHNYLDWIDMAENKYIKAFIENFVATFRRYNADKFVMTINGLNCFIEKNKDEFIP